jgi:Cu/Ag efflux pump CusA
MNRRPVDVLSLVVGLTAVLVGIALLWTTFLATPTALIVKIAIPVALVGVGIIGLLAARN